MRSKHIIPWVVALTLAGGSSAAMASDTFNNALGGGLGGAIGAAIGGSMGGQTGAVIGGGLGGAGGAILAGKYNEHDDDHYRGRDWDHRRRDVHYGHRDHDRWRHHGWDRRDWR
ncbi:hypothetical protein [Salinisphaera hydrothermalis]|uniref:17 kDa surface antigen n=1 Tax=Salinisphaera hydrothermalis (strain C41B8) TaxID=1304275 RepID=A0A084IN50_SALHC|nr:hypothetical protein [Salinisphaera hydrothermalis]KEZ78134.1 hypothetical protein C41B8_06102 [Salinisphaera hydrothermalis C41B8]